MKNIIFITFLLLSFSQSIFSQDTIKSTSFHGMNIKGKIKALTVLIYEPADEMYLIDTITNKEDILVDSSIHFFNEKVIIPILYLFQDIIQIKRLENLIRL